MLDVTINFFNSSGMEKVYWKSSGELSGDPKIEELKNKEFANPIPVDEVLAEELEKKSSDENPTPRRDFLKYMGFSIAAASIAACEAPVQKSIPYLVKPEEITPGIPNYYASTHFDGHDFASVLVKTREGRPIKIEGNEQSFTGKGTNARVQGSVLSLYDTSRLQHPMINGKKSNWATVDKNVAKDLAKITERGGNIRILSSTIVSPSTRNIIEEFISANGNAKLVTYDAISRYGMLKANENDFGKKLLPSYHFDKADCIVSISCDFLGNWISPNEHASQYAENRRITNEMKMSRHIQIESNYSLTGASADARHMIKPSETGQVALGIYNRLASKAGASSAGGAKSSIDAKLDAVANELWSNQGAALVVSGSNDPSEQMIVNAINNLLGSYGSTINWDRTCYLRQGDDSEMEALINEMKSGQVDALIINNVNPVYTYPNASFADAAKKVGLIINFATSLDETAALAKYIAPDNHYLESWGDAMPYRGEIGIVQPTIQRLFDTRQMQDSMLKWMGSSDDYYTYLKNFWRSGFFTQQNGTVSFDAFWNKSVHDGVAKVSYAASDISYAGDASSAGSSISGAKDGMELLMYEKTGMGTGSHANNPWLQELPDPISRICWDNYINMSPAYMKENGINDGDIVEVSANNVTISGPAHSQPGQAPNTISVALGYGRTASGKVGDGVGFNAYPMVNRKNGAMQYYVTGVNVNPTGQSGHVLASVQTHGTAMGRSVIREVGLTEYKADPNFENPNSVNADYYLATHEGKKTPKQLDLWATEKNPGHPKPNHLWGMIIDMNTCIGCGSCVVACNAENNIPVVGKEEINNSRDMHWIRIDRYYSSAMTDEVAKEQDLGIREKWLAMEDPEENPEVVFQPMMCQHCNHAPCETVCPVAATTHSQEGLNMMAYNRCVGTRYCANNCPYKVRRFNWFRYNENKEFDYNMNNPYGRMVLNPDVTVRSRGVMEKCTMCVQRIQYGKLEAKKDRRRPVDGEIKTACAQVCPTNAITFGDYNDDKSQLAEKKKSRRNYVVLEEYNVQPNVMYQVKVRNSEA